MDVRMPDGTLVRDVPEGITQEDLLSRFEQYKAGEASPAQPTQTGPRVLGDEDTSSDLVRGITNTLPGIKETYNAAKVLTGKAVGSKEMMDAGVQGMNEAQAAQKVRASDEFTTALNKGIGTVLTDWLPYQIGSGIGTLAETAAFTGLGAVAGAATGAGVGAIPGGIAGLIERSIVKKGIKDAAEALIAQGAKEKAEQLIQNEAKNVIRSFGTTAGMAAQAGMHGAGETTGRALDELQQQGKTAEDLDLGRVLPAAAIHAITDFATEKITLGAVKGLNLSGLPAESTGKLVYDIAKAIGTTGLKEVIPEEIQTMAERYGANLSLADAQALKDYINTAAASVGMSVVPGGLGGVHTFMNGKIEVKPGNETKSKDAFTGIDKNIETKVDTLTPEEAAAISPALDETGKSLAEAAPVVQNIVKPKTPEELQIEKNVQEANEKLGKLAEGKALHPSTIKSLFGKFGLERPEGMDNLQATQLLKDHLATIGDPNAPTTSTLDATNRVSSQISGQQGADTTAAGTTTTESGGVGGIKPPAQVSQTGEGAERPALKQQSTAMPTRPLPLKEESQTITPIESQAALEKDQAQAAQDEAARQAALKETIGQNIPQTKTDKSIREEYDLSRQAQKEAGVVIPAWEDLKADEKDTYLGSLKTNPSAEDFDNAAKTLAAYREQNKGSGLKPAEQRIVNGYEENRPIFQRSLGIDMPAWSSLSPEAQSAYTSKVKTNSPVEQGAGFTAVAEQLEQEGHGIRNVSREGVRNLKLKGTEEVSKAAATERIKKEAAEEASAQGKGEALSENTKAKLIAGDINGVLSDLISSSEGFKGLNLKKGDKTYRQAYAYLASIRKRASALTFRLLATSLNTLTFNSKVITDPNNKVIQRLEQEGKLAEYNPKIDTFYFTPGGFDESTVLHEIVHAGTVKIISQYLKDPSKLTQTQRDAAEHLQKIYDFSKKRLGSRFKNAYENLYEFVSYAMTDNKFQIALAETQVRPLAKYTAKAMAAWKQFTQALSKMFGLYDAKAQTEELTAEMYAQVAKEYGSMDPDELYEAIKDAETVGEFATSMLNEEGNEKEVVVKKEKVHATQARKFLTTYPGYEGNLMLEMSEVFSRILASPEKGIKVAPLAAAKKGAAGKSKVTKAEEAEAKLRGEEGDLTAPLAKDSPYKLSSKQKPKNITGIHKFFTTAPGLRRLATLFQNRSYNAKHLQDLMELANQTNWEDDSKINTVWTFLTLSNTKARNLYSRYIAEPHERLQKSIAQLAKTLKVNTDEALSKVHMLLEALHEKERRQVKYILTVPLDTNKILNNNTLSPADRRKTIVNLLDSKRLSKAQAQALRAELDTIVSRYATAMSDELSGKQLGDKSLLDINNIRYNVLGVKSDKMAARLADYEKNTELKPIYDSILANLKEINDVTTMLNKEANYWSAYVDNRVNFYGYDHYAPFKGKGAFSSHTTLDEDLGFESKRLGKDLQDAAYGFDGRFTPADNPVLQTMSDAVRAATRAGRVGLTQSVKNLLHKGKLNPNGQGIIAGRVIDHIPFNERDKAKLDAIPKDKTIFHYNEDGSIDILEIDDKPMLDSIRHTYQQTSTLTNLGNSITSFFGQLHTRYNFNFAPLNFVRDALTNAWAIGADLGPVKSAQFIGQISAAVANGGLAKAAKVAYLLETRQFDQLAAYAEQNAFTKNMLEFLSQNGMTSYLEGVSLKANYQKLRSELGISKIIQTKEQFDKFIDIYNNSFELASRTAAYGLMKSNYMTQGMTEAAAATRAAAYAKNLANFEQVGELGKAMGAFFMFFRPSATGAVRAIEAVAPAFRNINKVMIEAEATLPGLRDNQEAKDTFRKNYMAKKRNAQKMVGVLLGMGMTAYAMAALMADDDDMGRNDVLNDNMDQWTRFARFHLPRWISKDRTPIQLPWGFGLGAFAAAGAQFASVLSGSQSMKNALGNIFLQISLDSFVPIPVSRMNAMENPLAFAVDSMMPSTVRPLVEFVMNKNGLGQNIYNDSNRRMGDAYLGGDKIPQVYKDLAVWMANESLGGTDISPNSLYFFANSYADGASRIGELAYGLSEMQKGRKEFTAKTDLPLFGSFFGAKSSVDAREFSKMEKDVQEMQKIMNEFKSNPAQLARYKAEKPLNTLIVDYYEKSINDDLKDYRADANKIRANPAYDPKTKAELLKINQFQQNLIKYRMVSMFQAYGMKKD
jgi:hypothetical protein